MIGFPEKGVGAIVMCNSESGKELGLSLLRTISEVYNWPYLPSTEDNESIETQKWQKQLEELFWPGERDEAQKEKTGAP